MKKALITFLLVFHSGSLLAEKNLPEKSLDPLKTLFKVPVVSYYDGEKYVSLKDENSGFILLNFWATWCKACVQEMNSLDSLSKKIEKQNIKVVGVNVNDGGSAEVKSFLKKIKLKNMLILFDTNNKSFKDFGIRGLPTTFLISPEGEVIAKLEGATNWDSSTIKNQLNKYVDNYKQ